MPGLNRRITSPTCARTVPHRDFDLPQLPTMTIVPPIPVTPSGLTFEAFSGSIS